MAVWEAGDTVTDDRMNAGDGAGEQTRKVFVASGNLTSVPYVDIPGNGGAATSVQITKYGATSKLYVAMKTNAFSAASSTAVRLGIRINGVDYDVALGYFTNSNIYLPVHGWAEVAGLPAGTYTCQARWRISAGAGPVTANSGISELDMNVREFGL